MDATELREVYYWLRLTRDLDDRFRNLYRAGQILGNYFSAIGQEAVTVVPSFFLKDGDFIGPAHRELGAYVVHGQPLKALMDQALSRVTSQDKGRLHPGYFGWAPTRVLTHCAVLPSSVPVSVGAALAFKMRGDPNVAVNFIGEGATAKGDYHESLNFAGVHKLPVVFVIANNWYAESLPLRLTAGVEDLSIRAEGYGFEGLRIDGNDVVACMETFGRVIDKARTGGGPTLVQCDTYRWYGHSEIDRAEYRSKDEVQEWMKKDPLPRYEKYLIENKIMTKEEIAGVVKRCQEEIDAAVDAAMDEPTPTAADFDPADAYAP